MRTAKPQSAPNLSVLQAKTEEDRHRTYFLGFRTLVQEMESNSVHANHGERTISDPLDEKAIHLFLTANSQVIASIRITSGKIAKLPKKVNVNYQLDAFSDLDPTTLNLTT
jgi:hypothetical protein